MNCRNLFFWLALSLLLLSSCSKPTTILSGGKPRSYWAENASAPDKRLRKQAVMKLGNIGDSDPTVVPILVTALHDADAQVRCEAILALVKCGTAAREAIGELDEMQRKDPHAQVRAYAAKAVITLSSRTSLRDSDNGKGQGRT